MPQPACLSEHGVLLTVGCNTNGDRWEMVMPLGYDDALGHIDSEHVCQDAVVSFFNQVLPVLLPVLSSDTDIRFISAESMVDGCIPSRTDYGVGVNQGTGAAGATPSNVANLITFYEEPLDVPPGSRMRTGKTFISGTPTAGIVGDHITGGQETLLIALGVKLFGGFVSDLVPATKWYRYLAMPFARGRGFPILRVGVMAVRQYVATQRRRLTPH